MDGADCLKKDITKEFFCDEEYLSIVGPIIKSSELLKRKCWVHHENVSLYEHLIIVSYMSYKICKKRGWNFKDAAIGGLLHDFYYRPWQEHLDEKKPFFKQHGFVHASEALENSKKYFPEYMNDRVCNIILRHMFPLNITPPKYREGWVVTYVDKKVSMDIVLNVKAIPKYLGLYGAISRIKNFFKRK